MVLDSPFADRDRRPARLSGSSSGPSPTVRSARARPSGGRVRRSSRSLRPAARARWRSGSSAGSGCLRPYSIAGWSGCRPFRGGAAARSAAVSDPGRRSSPISSRPVPRGRWIVWLRSSPGARRPRVIARRVDVIRVEIFRRGDDDHVIDGQTVDLRTAVGIGLPQGPVVSARAIILAGNRPEVLVLSRQREEPSRPVERRRPIRIVQEFALASWFPNPA